jgi:tetratricopeptide (TPR) repeat protein
MALLALSPAVSAARPSAIERAKQHAAKAKVHYDLGEYQQAAREYILVYRIKPLPALLYNIAQSYRQAGQHETARRFYRSYLRETKDPKERASAEKAVAEIDELIAGETKRTAEALSPDDAEKVPAQSSQPHLVAHLPTASLQQPPAQPAMARTEVAAGAARRVPAAALSANPAPARIEGAPLYRKWWFWTAAGVVVAGTGAAIALAYRGPGAPSSHLGTTPVF